MKLNLGCGGPPSQLDGYVNCDHIEFPGVEMVLDLEERLPFETDSIEEIVCNQTLEHIIYEYAIAALDEMYRVLKPGAKIKLSVPDWGNILMRLRTYNYSAKQALKMVFGEPMGQHRYGWTEQELTQVLQDVGFVSIKRDMVDHESILMECYK